MSPFNNNKKQRWCVMSLVDYFSERTAIGLVALGTVFSLSGCATTKAAGVVTERAATTAVIRGKVGVATELKREVGKNIRLHHCRDANGKPFITVGEPCPNPYIQQQPQ